MTDFLGTYYEQIGMTPSAVITTIAGMFVFVFVVSLCWGKLVEDFGPRGGLMAGGVIVGAIWVMNHALPGPGFGTMHVDSKAMQSQAEKPNHQWVGGVFAKDAEGEKVQHGLIFQSYRFGGPWIDMGWAAAVGLWVGSIFAGASLKKSLPSLLSAIIGGAIGGAILGLISYNAAM